MTESNKKKNFFSEWLEKLQQESWQLELLISGLALFGIWESQSLILRLQYYVDVYSAGSVEPYLNLFLIVIRAGWAIFLVNLLIHIIIRGLWIGAIGLRYVSGDIDFKRLDYSDILTQYFKKRIGSFDDYIERLEKLSSVLFSFTFLLFFMLVSIVTVNMAFAIIPTIFSFFIPDPSPTQQLILVFSGMFYYGLGFLVLIDFISLGLFKKIKDTTISKIYFYLYLFYTTIALSFVYRPILFNFIDNRYTRKLFFLAIPYALVILLGFNGVIMERYTYLPYIFASSDYESQVAVESIDWHDYTDLKKEQLESFDNLGAKNRKSRIRIANLSNYEIDGNVARLFLAYGKRDDDWVKKRHPALVPFRKGGVRHRFLGSGKTEDIGLDSINSRENREIIVMRRSVMNESEKLSELYQTQFKDEIEYYKQFDRSEIRRLRSEIEKKYRSVRETYVENRVKEVKSALLGLFEVSIDDLPPVTTMDCDFYYHPNMKEPGYLCYLPIDSLNYGKHILKVKKVCGFDGDDEVYCRKIIPFRKY